MIVTFRYPSSTGLQICTIVEKIKAFVIELEREWNRPERTDDDFDSFLTRIEKLVNMSNTCDQIHIDCGFEELTQVLQDLHKRMSEHVAKVTF